MRRPRVTGDPIAVIADHTNRLVRKFEYPDMNTRPAGPGLGGGAGDPTVFLAASNATGMSKLMAHFESTGGAHDLVIFNEAKALLSSEGGRIVLSEGDWNLSGGAIGDVLFGEPVPMHLHGLGVGVTNVFAGGSFLVREGSTISNLTISFTGVG